MLQHKKILIGVTGGIAAYKMPMLIRLLVKAGADVKVVITKDAETFVTPQVLSVLSKNEVVCGFFDASHNWNNHVKLAEWADMFVIAPLTANTLSKMVSGLCDNVLMATYLSARSKVAVAPAMDLDMYQHPATRKNLDILQSYGHHIIPAESGELASGLSGEGRMAEPETIFRYIEQYFDSNLPLKGKKVLINAGPTYEALDPVRFIGNRSSGKMGIAIAEAFAEKGAQVTLVVGPTALSPEIKAIQIIHVESAAEMLHECMNYREESDVIVCAAAVADYRASQVSSSKIKKGEGGLHLSLEKTQDILKSLASLKKEHQCLVGFALETENTEEYAQHKLKEKGADIIIANSALQAYGTVFGSDANKITILDKHNKITKFELISKKNAAREIVNYIMSYTGVVV
jgi:phosphopantothenoylcysteine decarboxylase/phosphopantothenate--cysteine ligase